MSEESANAADLFEIIRTTRSMRRLKPDPVPNALIRKILEAGVFAPSGGNIQRWPFLVIRDAKIKETVGPTTREPGTSRLRRGIGLANRPLV
jgi:nitroreductase